MVRAECLEICLECKPSRRSSAISLFVVDAFTSSTTAFMVLLFPGNPTKSTTVVTSLVTETRSSQYNTRHKRQDTSARTQTGSYEIHLEQAERLLACDPKNHAPCHRRLGHRLPCRHRNIENFGAGVATRFAEKKKKKLVGRCSTTREEIDRTTVGPDAWVKGVIVFLHADICPLGIATTPNENPTVSSAGMRRGKSRELERRLISLCCEKLFHQSVACFVPQGVCEQRCIF